MDTDGHGERGHGDKNVRMLPAGACPGQLLPDGFERPAKLIDPRRGKWVHGEFCIRGIPAARRFAWVSFRLSESWYDDGAVIDFRIDNLRATRAPARPDFRAEVGPEHRRRPNDICEPGQRDF